MLEFQKAYGAPAAANLANELVSFATAAGSGRVTVSLNWPRSSFTRHWSSCLWVRRLLGNGVKNLIEETRQECAGKPQAQQVYEELGSFVHNIERMQYRTFRRQGLFIGSGAVEAGCKNVIRPRCRQSGMFWGMRGAENILALRCIHASRRRDHSGRSASTLRLLTTIASV